VGVFGGYDDDVNTNVGAKQGSAYSGGNITLDYTFGDPRLQIVLNAGGGGVYYIEHVTGQDYDIDLKGAFGMTYKWSPRLTLGTTALVDYLTEPNFDNPGGLNSRNGNYLYTTDNVFVTYAWSRRFNTKTSYTFEAYKYEDNAVALFSDRVSNVFGNEFQLQMVPTTKLVAEYRYGIVTYANEGAVIIPASFNPFTGVFTPAVLLQSDSTTHYFLGGIDHVFNPRFSGSLRGGAEFRSYDGGEDRNGPYFEGTLNYAVGRRTSVSWITRYGIEEPEIAGAQSRTTFRTGLHAKFDLTSRVSSTFDAYYLHDDYHSLNTAAAATPAPIQPFSEDSFDVGLGVRYAITPLIGVQASYHYTDVTSDMAGREYSRNRFSGGVSFTF
jgi:opacity protein-like surface antigen